MSTPPKLFASGDDYELQMAQWSRPVGEQFVDWLGLPEGLRWVDVGCGNGAFAQVILKRAKPSAVAGVDPSEGQIEYARKHVGAANAKFDVGDAQDLPFADASFDVAAMALVIAFVPDTARAIAEMKRVTKPGGWVGTYMWDMMAGSSPVRPVYEALRKMGYDPSLPPRAEASRREAMQDYWEKAGLEDVETKVIHITVVHPNFESFWDANSRPSGPQGVVLSKMPPAEKEKARTTLREILPIAADGSIRYESFANAVKGRVPR